MAEMGCDMMPFLYLIRDPDRNREIAYVNSDNVSVANSNG